MSDRFIRSREPQINRRPLSKRLRFEVLERDSFGCQYCGAGADEARLNVDHIWAHSKGGPDLEWNLITSCWPCNIGKTDRGLCPDRLLKSPNMVLAKHFLCAELYRAYGKVPDHSYFQVTLTVFFPLEEMEALFRETSSYSDWVQSSDVQHLEALDDMLFHHPAMNARLAGQGVQVVQ